MALTDPETLVGRTLGDTYRVERELGSGGMGAVFVAVHVRTGRRYAVKVLLPEVAARREALARFQREAEAIGALGHAHIVAIHDFAHADGLAYLVMDLLEGEDLAQRLARRGTLPLNEALAIFEQVASGLAAAHDQGLIHRDLKPANIFLAQQPGAPERAVLLDFGLAKGLAPEGDARLTASGVVMGTPQYMSPEQACGAPLDQRTDLYALATILYELLAGEPPITAPTLPALFAKLATEPAPPLSIRRPDLPPALSDALARALAKAPGDCPPDARRLVDSIRVAAGLAPVPRTGVHRPTVDPHAATAATPISNPDPYAPIAGTPVSNPSPYAPTAGTPVSNPDPYAPTAGTPASNPSPYALTAGTPVSNPVPATAMAPGATPLTTYRPPPPRRVRWWLLAGALTAIGAASTIAAVVAFTGARSLTDPPAVTQTEPSPPALVPLEPAEADPLPNPTPAIVPDAGTASMAPEPVAAPVMALRRPQQRAPSRANRPHADRRPREPSPPTRPHANQPRPRRADQRRENAPSPPDTPPPDAPEPASPGAPAPPSAPSSTSTPPAGGPPAGVQAAVARMQESDWRGCIRATHSAPRSAELLGARMNCALRAGDRAEMRSTCAEMRAHYPSHPQTRSCEQILQAYGWQ